MKKLLLIIYICSFLGCIKDDAADDVTNYYWVLEKAVISPAMTMNGKKTTDYMNMHGSGGCLANNYTYTFLANGIYQLSSNGPLCDMLANSKDQKWVKDGNELTLKNGIRADQVFTVEKQTMKNADTFTADNVVYTVNYTFQAKAK